MGNTESARQAAEAQKIGADANENSPYYVNFDRNNSVWRKQSYADVLGRTRADPELQKWTQLWNEMHPGRPKESSELLLEDVTQLILETYGLVQPEGANAVGRVISSRGIEKSYFLHPERGQMVYLR